MTWVKCGLFISMLLLLLGCNLEAKIEQDMERAGIQMNTQGIEPKDEPVIEPEEE
jgi:hypothetical protein